MDWIRNRPIGFEIKNGKCVDLICWIEERSEIIERTEDWEEIFLEETFETAESISFFPLRLSGHLACQQGQINDHRRLMLN